MSGNPARLLKVPGGRIAEGEVADLAIVDLNEEWTVEPEKLHSKSINTVFKGKTLIGKVKMTLLGGGGAATAIAVQAALDGVSSLHIFNRKGRSFDRAAQLADRIQAHTCCKVSVFDLADESALKQSLADSAILTNATSLGMAPKEDACPIANEKLLHPGLIVSDIIYNPRKTRLLLAAERQGCQTFNGLYMLLFQGAEAFRLWTGQGMPVAPIKEKYFHA